MSQTKSKPRKSSAKQLVSEILIARNSEVLQKRVLIGTPTLGQIRIEWHNAMSGLVVPLNWSNSNMTPIGFATADGQNVIAQQVVQYNFDWMLLIEDDTCPPPDLLIKLNQYIKKADVPIVSGLYVLKSPTPQPFVFRGRGNGSFTKFKIGDRVWCDGVPTGCLLVHGSIIREMWKDSESYQLRNNGEPVTVRRIFETPRYVFTDLHASSFQKMVGTSDLFFCDRILHEGVLKKAGWSSIARKKYPFLVDTEIHCGHIDRDTGLMYYWPDGHG